MSAEMSQITQQMGLTDEGLEVFTDARPQLLDSNAFLLKCADSSLGHPDSDVATVGCFVGSEYASGQIAIFRPSDPRLINQSVVTAAHEMLHAAFSQLSNNERASLEALLEARWSQVPADDPIQASFAGSVGNRSESRSTEQFAYLGTTTIDAFEPALEEYYDRYFADRSRVVAAYVAKQTLWTSLQTEYHAASIAMQSVEHANGTESAQLQADRAQRDADFAAATRLIDNYNALSADERANTFVRQPDGRLGEPYGNYLNRLRSSFVSRDADLALRQTRLDAAVVEAKVAREEVERLLLDLETLSAATVPSRG
jgi:hypothetical protein